MHKIAAGEAARSDGFSARFGDLIVRDGGDVQAQVSLLFLRIRSVAGKAFVGEDALYIAVEVDLLGQGSILFLNICGQFEAAARVEDEQQGDDEAASGKQSVTHGWTPVS